MQAIVSILVLRQAPYSLSRSASPEKRIDVVMRRRSPGRSGGAKPAVPRTSPGDDDDYSNEINKGTGFTARPFYRSHRPLTGADALRVAIPGCRRPLCVRERRVPGPCGPRTDATLAARQPVGLPVHPGPDSARRNSGAPLTAPGRSPSPPRSPGSLPLIDRDQAPGPASSQRAARRRDPAGAS